MLVLLPSTKRQNTLYFEIRVQETLNIAQKYMYTTFPQKSTSLSCKIIFHKSTNINNVRPKRKESQPKIITMTNEIVVKYKSLLVYFGVQSV